MFKKPWIVFLDINIQFLIMIAKWFIISYYDAHLVRRYWDCVFKSGDDSAIVKHARRFYRHVWQRMIIWRMFYGDFVNSSVTRLIPTWKNAPCIYFSKICRYKISEKLRRESKKVITELHRFLLYSEVKISYNEMLQWINS